MPKKIKIAINGFGRIGRAAFKVALTKPELEVAAINDLTDAATLAHLLKYDTAYGIYEKKVLAKGNNLIVGNIAYPVFSEKEPAKLPWKAYNINVVLECSGRFTDKKSASQHLKAGAKKVIISAPTKDGGVPTIVLGVNQQKYKGQKIINNASCTTNCIAPIAKIIQDALGIHKAAMTTVHSYTADQNLHDGPHRDLRRARAAAANIVPTTTGAAIATTETIPKLKNLFDGLSIRVPTLIVSLSDFTFLVKRKTSKEAVNKILTKAARSAQYKNILAVTNEPLVSSDLIKNPYSAIADLSLTKVINNDLVKIIAWYDNEWGYANRLVELVKVISR